MVDGLRQNNMTEMTGTKSFVEMTCFAARESGPSPRRV